MDTTPQLRMTRTSALTVAACLMTSVAHAQAPPWVSGDSLVSNILGLVAFVLLIGAANGFGRLIGRENSTAVGCSTLIAMVVILATTAMVGTMLSDDYSWLAIVLLLAWVGIGLVLHLIVKEL